MAHVNCRGGVYPLSQIARLIVPDNKVTWTVSWTEYDPPLYNAPVLSTASWADDDIHDPDFKPKFNKQDGLINRKSHLRDYEVVNAYPLNPLGRTGLKGRGLLGKWGPNHGAESIITKWKRDDNNRVEIHGKTSKPILQLCAIKKKMDMDTWWLPGGFMQMDETVTRTIQRKFLEEAMNILLIANPMYRRVFNQFFMTGMPIFSGYVDDFRNTDNAWRETIVVSYHDEEGDVVKSMTLKPGKQVKKAEWVNVDRNINMYSVHTGFLERFVRKINAHW